MLRKGKQIFEVLILRSVPGLINLYVFMSLGLLLPAKEYGIFSTVIAASGALSSLIYGGVTFSVVAMYSACKQNDVGLLFEKTIVSTTILTSLIFLVCALPFVVFNVVNLYWLLPCVFFGVYTSIQEIHHARIKFFHFAGGALSQALIFYALVTNFVENEAGIDIAFLCFGASYAFGALVSFLLTGSPFSVFPSIDLLKKSYSIGFPVVLSTLAADAFVIGFRLVLVAAGAFNFLGVFSYCFDVAQRLVGFVINVASFALVPRAFKASSKGDEKGFAKILREGALLAVFASVGLIGCVFSVKYLFSPSVLESAAFDSVAFFIVSLAVVVNRVGKMVLGSYAMKMGKTLLLLKGYIASGVVAILFLYISLLMGFQLGVYISFLLGFVVWAATCYVGLRRLNSGF